MMRLALGLMVLAATGLTAMGQVVLDGPRYQYGRYNEVIYGGRNPLLTSGNYAYLPNELQTAYAVQRMETPWFLNGWTPNGAGGPFVSPYVANTTVTTHQSGPYIFTDYLPFVEVSQFGFTVDQARNEAYANVPRIQTGVAPAHADRVGDSGVVTGTFGPAGAPMGQAGGTAAPAANPKLKAIPLLNWAKAERTRNPALFKALIQEARKYDPAAAGAVESGG